MHGFLYDRARYGDDQWVPIREVELRSDYDDELVPPRRARHRRAPTTTPTTSRARCGRTSRCATGANGADDPHHRGHDDVALRATSTGAGLSEYLDQIVDGRPVGVAAGG